MMNWNDHPWAGVFPATLCPFHEDESIDEQGLRDYIAELAAVDGIQGLTCNGHTGDFIVLKISVDSKSARGGFKSPKWTGRVLLSIAPLLRCNEQPNPFANVFPVIVVRSPTDQVAIHNARLVDEDAPTDLEVELALGNGGHVST